MQKLYAYSNNLVRINQPILGFKPPFIGWYVGTCTSTSAGVTANLILSIHGTTETTLRGELVLLGDLGDGGAFQGTISNDQVMFTTTEPTAMATIEWRGNVSGHQLSGIYVVRCDNPDVDAALRHQEGIWSCKLIRSFHDPNRDDAQSMWVYHDGNEEGPFTTEEFIQRLNAGQWPSNAIVALNDQTIWSTAAACLEKIQAEAAARN